MVHSCSKRRKGDLNYYNSIILFGILTISKRIFYFNYKFRPINVLYSLFPHLIPFYHQISSFDLAPTLNWTSKDAAAYFLMLEYGPVFFKETILCNYTPFERSGIVDLVEVKSQLKVVKKAL